MRHPHQSRPRKATEDVGEDFAVPVPGRGRAVEHDGRLGMPAVPQERDSRVSWSVQPTNEEPDRQRGRRAQLTERRSACQRGRWAQP